MDTPVTFSRILCYFILTLIFPPLGTYCVLGCSWELFVNLCLMPVPPFGHVYGFYVQYYHFKLKHEQERHLQRIRRQRYAQRMAADQERRAHIEIMRARWDREGEILLDIGAGRDPERNVHPLAPAVEDADDGS